MEYSIPSPGGIVAKANTLGTEVSLSMKPHNPVASSNILYSLAHSIMLPADPRQLVPAPIRSEQGEEIPF